MSATHPASVQDWLESLGLGQYAAKFDEQAIDLGLLPSLGEVELQQLGVKALGHRIRLMQAASVLRTAAPASPAVPVAATAAERRQLTVLCCDMVGSTALSQRLDPEDLRALMQAYQQACAEVVAHHQGMVAQYLGDGLTVYFGWPRAHEDDARRSVACGLQLLDAVKAIAAPEPLQLRIAIATGPVVVGADLGNSDASRPRMAVGETPTLAARMQRHAEPDQVLVAAGTHRLLGGHFDCLDLGAQALHGIAVPQRLWRVLRESLAAGDRFAAAHATAHTTGLTPLVNRELEMSLLMDRWSRACDGQGQAVLLAGEAGIGKSRVLAELCQRVPVGSLLLRLQCSGLHNNSAYYPITAQMLRAAAIERADPPEQRLTKLEALLQQLGPVAQRHARHFAALLSLPLARYPALASSPAKARQETIGAVVQSVLDVASRQPVLVLAEDLHWMDPSSLEVLDALIAGMRRAPVLLLLTARHLLGARWTAQPHVTSLTMVGLNRGDSLRLAAAVVAQSHGLSARIDERILDRILDRIVEHTDGVPLFLEELTRALAEGAGGQSGADADAIEIPATLKDLLTARLDQLGGARRAIQLGALLGRRFRPGLVQALHGDAGAAPLAAELELELERAVAAGLLSRGGSGDDLHYTFAQALVQDAAYESLLKRDRRALHARAGDLLKAHASHTDHGGHGGQAVDTEPELLARHYTAGEVWDSAAQWWRQAGQRAWSRGAAKEAIAHLEAGIAAVAHVAEPARRDAIELELQAALGAVHFAAVSYAAPQAQAAYQRAEALCERISDVALKAPVLYGMGAFQTMKGDIRAGHRSFQRLAAEADAAATPRLQVFANAVLTWSHCSLGQYPQAIAASDRVQRLCQAGAPVTPRMGATDPRILSGYFRAAAQWALGDVDQACATSDGVLALARTLDPYSLAYALNTACVLLPELCGDDATVSVRTEEGIALAAALGYPFLEVAGQVRLSLARRQTTGPAPVLAAVDGAIASLAAMGVGYMRCKYLVWRARLLLQLGDHGAAQLAVAQALGALHASGHDWVATEVYLTEGQVLLAHGGEQRALAAAAFRTGLDVAQAQGARSFQLRATLALAQLAAEDDGPAAATAVLAPMLAGFDQGQHSADHREAAALLAQWR